MTTYRIISDNTSLGNSGDTINDDALVGLNVDALIEGGHIESIAVKSSKSKDQDKKDND